MRAAMLVMILTKSLTRSSLVSSGNTPQVLNSLIILLSPIIEGKARFVNHQTNKDQCRMHHRISGVYSRVDPCGQYISIKPQKGGRNKEVQFLTYLGMRIKKDQKGYSLCNAY